jgi:hypothetical protein
MPRWIAIEKRAAHPIVGVRESKRPHFLRQVPLERRRLPGTVCRAWNGDSASLRNSEYLRIVSPPPPDYLSLSGRVDSPQNAPVIVGFIPNIRCNVHGFDRFGAAIQHGLLGLDRDQFESILLRGKEINDILNSDEVLEMWQEGDGNDVASVARFSRLATLLHWSQRRIRL